MLHPIPDSPLRTCLIRLVGRQRQLVKKLCALPESSSVDADWLKNVVWTDNRFHPWIDRFWNNQKGRRQSWLRAIAAASTEVKVELLDVMKEQCKYMQLYSSPPTIQLKKTDKAYWNKSSVHQAMKDLMVDFYVAGLSSDLGFPGEFVGANDVLTRKTFLQDATPAVCPYCDNGLQRVELDHFLPKSSFPFLSVHPDNLIPSCHDSNTGDHKGETISLDWAEAEQAKNYFHPRLRPAHGCFHIGINELPLTNPTVQLKPIDADHTARVQNLDSMFRLAEFWGRTLESDIQDIQKEVVVEFQEESLTPSVPEGQRVLNQFARNRKRRIGRKSECLYEVALYEHAASSEWIIKNAIKQFHQDSI